MDIPDIPGAHPELKNMLIDFTTRILVEKPEDLVAFGLEYFTNQKLAKDEANQPEDADAVDEDGKGTVIDQKLGERQNRRRSVFDEAYDPSEDVGDILTYEKTSEQRDRIREAIRVIFMFRGLDDKDTEIVIDAMIPREVTSGEVIIKQGDEGDFFYVIDKGIFEALIENKGVTKSVHTYKHTGSFGELALMYNEPRAASVIAKSNGFLWALDRKSFKRLVLKSAYDKRKRYDKLLTTVPQLDALSVYQRNVVCDALVPKSFKDGDLIFCQGEVGDGMYFVEYGEVLIVKTGSQNKYQEEQVAKLKKGDFFGERALITREPRAATAIASNDVQVAFLDIEAFERLLGPCMELMSEKLKTYDTDTPSTSN